MADVVLDASAMLARILAEPGADKVDKVLDGARISSVNLAEVVQRLIDLGMDDARIDGVLRPIPYVCDSFDEVAAMRVGVLRRSTRHLGLSVGDRACLELAIHKGFPAVTADRAWAELDLGVEVVLIR